MEGWAYFIMNGGDFFISNNLFAIASLMCTTVVEVYTFLPHINTPKSELVSRFCYWWMSMKSLRNFGIQQRKKKIEHNYSSFSLLLPLSTLSPVLLLDETFTQAKRVFLLFHGHFGLLSIWILAYAPILLSHHSFKAQFISSLFLNPFHIQGGVSPLNR